MAGERIAFSHATDGDNSDVYVMDADGSNVALLTHNSALDGDPAWSPNGSRIVFRSDSDGNVETYAMDADGSTVTRLTDNAVPDQFPYWFPLP